MKKIECNRDENPKVNMPAVKIPKKFIHNELIKY